MKLDISEALNKKKAEVWGWIAELRDIGKLKFIQLRDQTGTMQVIVKNPDEKTQTLFNSLNKDDYIKVKGSFVENSQAINGKEMVPEKIEIISKSEQPLPIDISGKIKSGLDKEIDWRFIWMRRPETMAIFKLKAALVHEMAGFLVKNGFTQIFSSKMVNVPTEGGTEYFTVKYFDRNAYLAQSPQFYKELSLLSGLDRVFEIGMVYRAEPHHTPRHLCEYVSFDYEMVTRKMEDVMKMEEKMLKYVFTQINKKHSELLKKYNIALSFPKKIPRIKFREAVKIVEGMGVKTEPGDITPAGERALCEWAKKEKNSDFVFLTGFPWEHKVFYAKKTRGNASESFDLLYKGVEITTGGLREENYEERASNMKEKGLDPEKFDHLRFFKYGMPPHGGLAVGMERFTQLILGLENVREASLTPRDPTRLTP